jgi:SAM-dependent methyltransferase
VDLQLKYWNNLYKNYHENEIVYDMWLNKFVYILEKTKDTPIIDLGCGYGNDTLFLIERGFDVISCDYCIEAINRLKRLLPSGRTSVFNIANGIPFEKNSFKVIIADLSLHYFSQKITEKIINNISEILINKGYLILRVNSVKDVNHGAGQGIRIEENFYNINGHFKRFFNLEQVHNFFNNWDIEYLEECEMNRYKEKKIVWEICVKNISE